MVEFLQNLKSFFRFRGKQQPEEATVNDILHKEFLRLRNVDPETQQQWLRLQSATKAAPVKSRLTPLTGLIPRLALGVTVVALATVGVYIYFSSKQPPPDIFTTAKGEQKEVVLEDSSQITLNYATEFVVPKPLRGKLRRVSLTGEAYFRVRTSETPFIVSTEYAEVQVVGTEFNLQARGGALEVAVISGIVNISAAKDGKDSTLLLTEHQMALVPRNDFPRRTGDIPSPDYPGWMHGKLFLNRTSFLAAVREVEMRFDVTVAIHDRELREKIITGILDARTAEVALAALCELTGKKFTHDGQEFHVY